VTRRDVPYVTFITVCMVVAFISGRHSASRPSTSEVTLITTAHPSTPVLIPVVEPNRIVPVEAPPPVAKVAALPEIKMAKAVPRPVDVKPTATPAPIAPLKIDLEDDPVEVANPYVVPKTAASTPGF
jgi:hypothetical protein